MSSSIEGWHALRLSEFLTTHVEEILIAWEAFARTQSPGADEMNKAQLRDHAKLILEAIALDLDTPQSGRERDQKSKGLAPAGHGEESAASTHGSLREASGFTLLQLTAEFRALRASVLKLWQQKIGELKQPEIADLIRFNEAIDQALAESVVEYAARAARSRDTFLAMLGHDLRSPLAAMVSSGDYLLRPEARHGDISAVGARVKRTALMMSGMVNDMLEYARSQLGGAMPMKPAPSDLREVAVYALRDANAVHPECAFQLEADGDLPGEFDADRIQQVLTNLLINAAQYRDKTSSVTLSLTGDAQRLELRVKNRGPVIPAQAFDAIFNPLVQLAQMEAQPGRPTTSMGLGLFIAKEVTNAHGGAISVTSSEKQGTVFTVSIPRQPPQSIQRL
jgi:signal transduction histidine kinase